MQGEPRPHPGLSDRPGRGAAGGSSRRAPARLACGVSKVCLACELRRCSGSAVRHQMVRVPAPAISHLRPGLRLACPARPVIGLQGRRAARAAARGRSAAPRQPAAPAGLGRPRSRRRADPAPAASAAYVPAGHPRAPSCAGTAGACDFCVRTRFGQPRRPNGWACLRPAATASTTPWRRWPPTDTRSLPSEPAPVRSPRRPGSMRPGCRGIRPSPRGGSGVSGPTGIPGARR